MSQFHNQSMPQEKFLTVAINLLHKAFVEASRTEAKNTYREIAEGKPVHLTTVRMEDGSTSRFALRLDHSEYRGKLNYGAFRASLAALIGNFGQALKDEREINVFNAQDNPGTLMFGVTAVTLEDDIPNVMVMGAELAGRPGEAMLSLMYLDPSQFMAPDEARGGEPVQS
jgi:hypothetical protein